MNYSIENIDWHDRRMFKVWNYRYTTEEVGGMIIDALAVLLGDYGIYRKKAAIILLKMLVRDQFLKFVLENADISPYDRNDYRVRKWAEAVVAKGACELCASTEHLEAHHIIKWADFPHGRIDMNNGMCLCHDCHTEEHKYDQSYHMMKARFSKKR